MRQQLPIITQIFLVVAFAVATTSGGAAAETAKAAAAAAAPGWSSQWTEPQTEQERTNRAYAEQYRAAEKSHDYRAFAAAMNREVQAHPNLWYSYTRRGIAYNRLRQFDLARADFNHALDLAQRSHLKRAEAVALYNRAITARMEHNWNAEVADLRESMKRDSRYAYPVNQLAWLRATCPDAGQRNGIQAVELAHRTTDLAGKDDPDCADTLAAAYAENGDFGRAVEEERKALWLFRRHDNGTNGDKFLEHATAHLALYQARKPFRADEQEQ